MKAKTTFSMFSFPTCNHIIIENDIISPCSLFVKYNYTIPYFKIKYSSKMCCF